MFNSFRRGNERNETFFMMKKVIITAVLILFAITAQAQTKTVKKDSVPLFYGLTAEKIISLSVPEGKALIKERYITVSQYFITRSKAKTYLSKQNIKRDSIETMQIYDRIEKKLGMKKTNGKNKSQ